MNSIKIFVNGFVKREGVFVLISSLVLKFSGLLISVFIVRLLKPKTYGEIVFSLSFIGLLSVFSGLGCNWSLLRFGPTLNSQLKKYNMFKFSLFQGSKYTFLLILLVVILSFFLPPKLYNSIFYIRILSISLLTNFLFESLKSYFRILNKNKLFSLSNIIGSISLFFIIFLLTYFLGDVGYVTAIVLAPLVSFLFFYKHIFFNSSPFKMENSYSYFKYGIQTSLGVVVNQVVLTSGPIIAGYLNASSSELAVLKVATIIPFNLMFIPSVIMSTDFVHFSKNFNNYKLLKEYYLDYFKTIFLISFLPFIFLLFYNNEVIELLFGKNYSSANELSIYLILATFFSFLLRIPLGNILAAVGKADWNVYHALFWFVVFIPLSYFLFLKYRVFGIALSISTVFFFSSFVSLFLFVKYLKSIK